MESNPAINVWIFYMDILYYYYIDKVKNYFILGSFYNQPIGSLWFKS